MDEKQLIKKLEQLKTIEPKKDWVISVKKEIMGEDRKSFDWMTLFYPVQRPALVLAFRGAMVAMFLLVGSLLYMYYLSSQTAQTFLSDISSILESNNNDVAVSASLQEVQESLKDINSSLANIKNIKDQKQALAMSEVIKETANRGEEAVKEIKKGNSKSRQILAALGEVQEDFKKLKEESGDIQKEMIQAALDDLGQITLSDENKERLASAKECFSQGDLSGAMVLIIKIME